MNEKLGDHLGKHSGPHRSAYLEPVGRSAPVVVGTGMLLEGETVKRRAQNPCRVKDGPDASRKVTAPRKPGSEVALFLLLKTRPGWRHSAVASQVATEPKRTLIGWMLAVCEEDQLVLEPRQSPSVAAGIGVRRRELLLNHGDSHVLGHCH